MNLKHNPILKSSKIRVGITIGDPSGIGPAITLKAIRRLKGLADYVIIGDKWVFDKIPNAQHLTPNTKFIDLNNVNHKTFKFGKVRAEYGRASIEYLDRALELIKNRQIDCLVTSPVSKEAVSLAGFNFRGHTEYLAKKTKTKHFVMFLLNRYLRFGLVTGHTALNYVPLELSKLKLARTILLTYISLKKLFSIKNPRIVVCGLNPHASDNGLMGNEENKIIKPVLVNLKYKIRYLDGPLSADVAIRKARQEQYDCVIAMYHDQAVIALKLLGADTGINMTLGLPFVRTSPLHGTAFDIAGNFAKANPSSLIAAIKLAVKCTSNLKED